MTLQDVFDSLDMTAYDLSIDTLDTHVSSFSIGTDSVCEL